MISLLEAESLETSAAAVPGAPKGQRVEVWEGETMVGDGSCRK